MIPFAAPAPVESPLSILSHCPVVPVVVISDAARARTLGEVLVAAGVTIVEITLRTPAGLPAIHEMAGVDGLLVGAGTVMSPGQVDEVVDRGGRFVVSPGLSPAVLERASAHGVASLPGIATATELMAAVDLGVSEVKFFPAESLGGPAAIAALAGPFRGLSFLPSGGVNRHNMDRYLELDCVPAISASWMVDSHLIESENWAEIGVRCRDVMAACSAGGKGRNALPGAGNDLR